MRILLHVTLFFTLFFTTPLLAQQEKHILILNSYHQSMSWVNDIVRGVYDTLEPDKNNIIMHIENMDTKRYYSPEYFEMLKITYAFKYNDIKIDMVLSSDDHAFDFLRNHGEELFGDIPIIFCGVNTFTPQKIAGRENYTGVIEVIDALSTVKVMLKAHPETKKIFIITDYLKTGNAWRDTIHKELSKANLDVELEYSSNLPLKELKAQIDTLEKDTLILLGVYFSDRDGKYLTYETIAPQLLLDSPVPVYNLLEFNINNNVVGGSVISGYHQAKLMASIAKQVLAGTPPNEIPVITKDTSTYIFNHPAMVRYDIDITKLPEDSIFLNKPTSFFETYKNNQLAFNTLLIFLLFLTVLVLVLGKNIFRKKEVEKQLASQLAFQQNLIDTVNIPIFIKDLNGIYLGCNKAFETILGIKKEEVIGKSVFDLAPADLAAIYKKADDDLLAKGGFQEYQTQIKTADGSKADVIFQKNTFNDTTGKVAGLVGAYFDISEILETKEELRILNETLEHKVEERTEELSQTIDTLKKTQTQLIQSEKMASLGSLVAGVAHEINTPIGLGVTGVSHFEEMAKRIHKLYQSDSLSKEEFEDFLTSATEISDITLLNLHRASDIIKSFKQVAIDQSSVEKRDINLNQYINEILLSLHNRLKHTKHTINVECDEDIDIHTYPGAISQILTNLILNTLIHAFEFKDAGKIDILVTKKEEMIHLHFEDNGKGIAKENLAKIFDPFFTTKLGVGGSGLGLNIIYNIITAQLGGTIHCKSQEGKGTIFDISFPINYV